MKSNQRVAVKYRKIFTVLSTGFLFSFTCGIIYSAIFISANRYLSYRMFRLAAATIQLKVNCWVICFTGGLFISLLSFWLMTGVLPLPHGKRGYLRSGLSGLIFLFLGGWSINRFCLPGKTHPLSLAGNGLILIFTIVLVYFLKRPSRIDIKIRLPEKCLKRSALVVLSFLLIMNGGIWADRKLNLPDSPNLIIIMVDALRKDHLGLYGYHRNTSPNLDRFALDGKVFQNAVAQCSWTNPSIASFFTSLYGSAHGCLSYMDDRRNRLDYGLVTLAEGLKDKNYATGAFCANHLLKKSLHFDQGFDVFDGIGDEYKPNARKLSRNALSWILARKDRPFFAYLHYMDAHGPYSAPGDYAGLFQNQERRPLTEQESEMLRSYVVPIAGNDLNYYIDQYDGLIRYVDDEIGRLLEVLSQNGVLENSIVVFISDHGEAFFDHGFCTHGRSLYGEEIDVPLVVSVPPSLEWNPPVDENLSLIDLTATLLHLLKCSSPYPIDGRVVGENNSIGSERGPIYSEEHSDSGLLGFPKVARIEDGYKAIYMIKSGEVTELYDLKRDPREKNNLAEELPKKATDLSAKIKSWLEEKNRQHNVLGSKMATFSHPVSHRKKELRALGYM
jgi:arylsulfatase A-like enzyme